MKQKEISSNLSMDGSSLGVLDDETGCQILFDAVVCNTPFPSLLCMMGVGCPARSSLACGPLSAWAGPLPSACGFPSRAEQGGTSVPGVASWASMSSSRKGEQRHLTSEGKEEGAQNQVSGGYWECQLCARRKGRKPCPASLPGAQGQPGGV